MKRIVIVGAGISALSALHFLNQKYSDNSQTNIVLLEAADRCGGTIRTQIRSGLLFEHGPNGFLDNKPRTFELIKQLGIEDKLVQCSSQAQLRFISLNGRLHPIPTTPQSFIATSLLNPFQKIRIFRETAVPKGIDPFETIYDFGTRRFGRRMAEIFLDSMVSGIYAGDIRKICIRAAFPKIYELEQTHGSLFRALKAVKKEKKSVSVMPKSTLYSFKEGMGTIIHALSDKYSSQIQLNNRVVNIAKSGTEYILKTAQKEWRADHLIMAVPAYQAAPIFKEINPSISQEMARIDYAPIVVVGLVFDKNNFKKLPQGFGFLIPSLEKSEVLGVLFESNIFPDRANEGSLYFRIMLGGSNHRETISKTKEDWIRLSREAIKKHFGVQAHPQEIFVSSWPRGIPQYDRLLTEVNARLDKFCDENPQVSFLGNFRGGVSMNDCIENAFMCAQRV